MGFEPSTAREPRLGDHFTVGPRQGIFEPAFSGRYRVVGVSWESRCANLKCLDPRGGTLADIPWSRLQFLPSI